MTKQEAIEILRDTPIDVRSTREDDIHTLYATAQGMAIEALSSSEPKTSESGSVDSEMPEIKTDRTIGGMIYRQDAIDALWEKRQALNDFMDKCLQDDLLVLRQQTKIERNRIEEDINIIEELPPVHPEPYRGDS